jgi:hypothetical protein
MEAKSVINFRLSALVFITAVGRACGGSSHHNGSTTNPGSASNVQSISVNSGPNGNYANGLFTSVTVCVPSSSNCQIVDGVLVDTGSYGLRLLSSSGGGALKLSLPAQNGAHGNPMGECAGFVSGYTWGPVVTADVKMVGEQANNLPVQVIDSAFASVPSGCQALGVPEHDTLNALGANGILGIGPFVQDCGSACQQIGNANPGLYYECASTSCQVASEGLAQQVSNPVAFFGLDNNGVIINLPAVETATSSITGSLIFGIGTQSNNGLGGASVFPLNANAEFTTTFNGHGYPGFVDSGSNALFFLSSGLTTLPVCANDNSFYCPSSQANLSATTSSPGGATGTVDFYVLNADSLFSNSVNFVFPALAGPNSGMFDWGLPFFFGRNVFTAIDSRNTPGGMGPYWAF